MELKMGIGSGGNMIFWGKKLGLGIALVAIQILGGCSGTSQQPATPAAAVEVSTVIRGPINDTITVYGDISADASLRRDLVAPVEAQITRIAAPFGSFVRRGEPVIYLRPSPQSQLDVTQAAIAASQAASMLARAKRLRADGLMSDADVETARTAASTAASLLRSLRSRNYILRASEQGTMTEINFSVGDIVAPGTKIAALTIDGDVRARFGIDPAIARLVASGDTIAVTPTSGGPTIATRVIAVDPVVDPVSRLASIFARISASTEIAPGEPLKGEITIGSNADALKIPQSGLLDDGGQKYVYTVVKGNAKRVDIAVGATNKGVVEVVSGLKPGDQIVTKGAAGVTDGIAVNIGKPSGKPPRKGGASSGSTESGSPGVKAQPAKSAVGVPAQ